MEDKHVGWKTTMNLCKDIKIVKRNAEGQEKRVRGRK